MTCEVHEADLSALLDGELGALEERRVRDHIATCRECRAAFLGLQKISTAIREIEAAAEPAPSPEFIDRVVSAATLIPRRPHARIVRFPSPLIAARQVAVTREL
jgi:anti-sigma factor RsiW